MDQTHNGNKANTKRLEHDTRLDAVHKSESEIEPIVQATDDGVGQNGVLPERRHQGHCSRLHERIDEGTIAQEQDDHVVSPDEVECEIEAHDRGARPAGIMTDDQNRIAIWSEVMCAGEIHSGKRVGASLLTSVAHVVTDRVDAARRHVGIQREICGAVEPIRKLAPHGSPTGF